jgi:hypothetical protein
MSGTIWLRMGKVSAHGGGGEGSLGLIKAPGPLEAKSLPVGGPGRRNAGSGCRPGRRDPKDLCPAYKPARAKFFLAKSFPKQV